jgi:hypothetical protein
MKEKSKETILYPLPQQGDKQTMLRIETEYIAVEHLNSDWNYTLIDKSEVSSGYSLSAAEVPNVVTRTAEGFTKLKTVAFLFAQDGTEGSFTEIRHTITELPADPVQLLLHGENCKNDPQITSIVKIWHTFVKGLKKEVIPKPEIAKTLSEVLQQFGNLN